MLNLNYSDIRRINKEKMNLSKSYYTYYNYCQDQNQSDIRRIDKEKQLELSDFILLSTFSALTTANKALKGQYGSCAFFVNPFPMYFAKTNC